MKTKSKHRWLALFMVVAMLIGTLPITVFAEDHTHTEDCYAKAGDLLCTIAELNDTNVLARGSHNDLNWLKHKAVMSLKRGGAFTASGMEQLVQMNQECIWRNISPGGSADILAAAIFLWKLEQLNEKLKDENQH